MVSASPIFDPQGRLTGSVHVARDITDRKLAEEALRKARDELETRVRERTVELFEANELLKEKIRTIDQLYEHVLQSGKAKAVAEHTAEVAHELRQPLAIIGGFARRISRKLKASGLADDEAQGEFSLIIGEVQRLEKILVALIDFTRRESIGLQPANPNELIESVLRVNAGRLQDKSLSIDLALDPDVGNIMLDPDLFQHVVRNLVANAIEASPRNEVIRIETRVSPASDMVRETVDLSSRAYFEMKIQNRGEAIHAVELEKVFNPFYTTKSYGTGLGLTLSRKIVEDHKGSISVTSDADGTLFTVWLPAMSSRAEEASSQKLRILIVDHRQPLLTLLKRELTKLGQSVFTALSGSEGLALYQRHPVDVVICDEGPERDSAWKLGIQIKALSEARGTSKTPFIVLTGSGIPGVSPERAEESGVDLVLERPVDIPELMAAIRKLAPQRWSINP